MLNNTLSFTIRPFHPKDLEAVIRLYQVSFSEELRVQGLTPETAARQVRQVARGWMIPFSVLTRLMGNRWGILVAEVDGHIAGLGAYFGDKHSVEIGPLMVAPEYRRQGIGQALLKARLEHIAERGGRTVTVTVLCHNQPSLGNLSKQGFEVYGDLTEFELPLPWTPARVSQPDLIFRIARPEERNALEVMEREALGATQVEIEGSGLERFYPTFPRRVYNRLLNIRARQCVVERDGRPVGLFRVVAENTSSKGIVPFLIAANHDSELQQAMLCEAANWLTQQGKQAMRVAVSGDNTILPAEHLNPDLTWRWLMLVKYLDR